MNVSGKTALVLGGAGLVGAAISRRLIDEGVGALLVGGLTEGEARLGAAELARPGSPCEIVPVWGNLFVRAEFAHTPPEQLSADGEHTARLLSDDLDELNPEIYQASHLCQLLLGTSPIAPGRRPELVVDSVNTATALAYGGAYTVFARALSLRRRGGHEWSGEIDDLLRSFTIPRLVRHVQLLGQALIEAETECYVKIGTTGTGGMGLNIPYTHGEEKPSRRLLTKSAIAGAHSMLLFLLARTPGGPAVKEIKPAAAITWKRIGYGPIRHRGTPMGLYDCAPHQSVGLAPGAQFDLSGAGARLAGDLESVFIDTGENGQFSLGEYTAITALGQMEAVTPEEIAGVVIREIRGRSTGRDVLTALDGAVMGSSYRAGALRSRAIAEASELVATHGATSVAFEILGPPRLSKLLYEAELLRRAYGTLDALAAADPADVGRLVEERLSAHDADLRRAAVSVGVPILMPGGSRLLAAEREMRQHDWERQAWIVDAGQVERWCHGEWIDLRLENLARWTMRAAAMAAERDAEAAEGAHSSGLDRHFATGFDIGEAAAWILEHEDGGFRA